MSEHLLQIMASLKIVWVGVFSYLYGEGGIAGKWKRRFVGASWMMLGVYIFSLWAGTWNPWYMLFLPIAIGGLCNGYGGTDETLVKIRRRAIYGFLLSCSAIPCVALSHMYILFACLVVLAVLSSVVLGVLNPCRNARDEETLIASLCFILTLYLI